MWDFIKKYRAIAISLGITFLFSILSNLNIVRIGDFSPRLIAGIFTVIIGSTATLFSILIVYGELIAAADNKQYLQDVERTFRWPVGTAVVGFIIAIIASTITVNAEYFPDTIYGLGLNELQALGMLTILLYAILSFREAFLFVVKSTIKMESKKNSRTGSSDNRPKPSKAKETRKTTEREGLEEYPKQS